MRPLGELWRRFWYLFNRRRMEAELREEMESHRAEMGEPARFGNTLRLREESRRRVGMELGGRHLRRHPLRLSDDHWNARPHDRRGLVSRGGNRNQHDGFLMDPGRCPSTDPGCHGSIRLLPDRAARRRWSLSRRFVARVPGPLGRRRFVQRSGGFPDGSHQPERRRTSRACVRASRLHQLFLHAGPRTASWTFRLERRRFGQHGGRSLARLLAEAVGRLRRCDGQQGASQWPGN